MLLGALLPLGVVAQIVLGGFTVLYDLAPGFVMSHYMLSMLILVALRRAGLARAPRARRARRRAAPPTGSLALRRLGAARRSAPITIFAGTAATAAGPHAGGAGTGDVIPRLYFKGADTLRYVIEQHARLATLLGIAAVALWVARAPPRRDARRSARR